jgi:peroxiredoxin/mono/diheme cytochrome c family protein
MVSRSTRVRAAALFGAGAAGFLALSGLSRLDAAPSLERPAEVIGRPAPEFRLKDQTGKTRTLAEFADRKALVVVFLGTQCPIANTYAPTLADLSKRYGARGVQFLGVNANPDDKADAVARHAKEYALPFPVLKDERQALADGLAARVTPEAFVLDGTRVVRYRGRVDDSYESRTQKRPAARTRDLELALESVLGGKPVSQPLTSAFGCAIARPQKSAAGGGAVTFHKDVERLIQDNCQTCHRPNQVAPFSLLTYSDAKSWAAEIKEFTQRRQMPPWKAEPGHGEFLDSRRMSDADLATIAAWVDAGAPKGNPKDAPPAREWADGWTLGKPDLVLKMPEKYQVSATGDDDFRCFVMPTGLTEDKQVVAMEVKPGNARVVHHVLTFLDSSGKGRELDAKDPSPGYNAGPGGIGFFPSGAVGGWAPGNMPRELPPGVYRPFPAKTDVVIQVHYHKTGKVEVDQTEIGFYFAKEPRAKQSRLFPLTNLNIDIPPGAQRHEIKASLTLPFNAQAISITPHMHLLGKEIKVTATLPTGETKSMIWVKDWDYRWQDTYVYKDGFPLPRGTRLDLVSYFDNSTSNPLNPSNPPKRVTFGEQTTDEMVFAFIDFTMDQEPPAFRPGALFGPRRPQ